MQFNFPLQPFTAKLHDSEEVPVKYCYDYFYKAAQKTNVIWLKNFQNQSHFENGCK